MLKNYFKIAFRNLWRNKGFSAINIAGLAIGMASAMLILLWIQNELSHDQFHEKKDNLYMAWNRDVFDGAKQCWSTTPKILAPTLKKDYPEIEQATRVNWNQQLLFSVGEKRLTVTGTMVDPDFLNMFSFPLLRGNPQHALDNGYSVVVTEKLGHKLFGTEDPMGKVVRIDNKNNFTVTGVMKDLPNNTRFDFEYLLPWEYMRMNHNDDSSWGNNSTQTYVLLKPNANIDALNAKVKNITIQHQTGDKTEVFLYPVSKLWLYSKFIDWKPAGGRIATVRVFGLIAIFILLIACINFMNLSTARSEKRAREVGIRKVAGARRSSLIGQFLGESILIALISGILAILIVQLSLSGFNDLTHKQLAIEYNNGFFWLSALVFILITGIIAGSYPAFYLSSFAPIKILKGTFKRSSSPVTARKVLVVVQFTFAIILIISTIIVEKQIRYAQERESGYSKQNLVYVFLEGDIVKNFDLIKQELISSGAATNVSKTSAPLTEGWSDTWGFEWAGKDLNSKIDVDRFCSAGDLVKTAGMTLVEGRDIDPVTYLTDSTACMVNQSTVKLMKDPHPIGHIISEGDNSHWHIVGVIKDFILRSPYMPLRPMVIVGPKGWFNVMHIKLNSDKPTSADLAIAGKIFKKYNPEYPFTALFVDEQYEKKFSDEKRTATLSSLFAGLTIFISCLGLFGLSAYMAENRKKEIGIRKILGASAARITSLLSIDFIKLVVISIVVAIPVAIWAMEKWLKGYEYRISMSWWIFFVSGVTAVIIALATVSFQAVRAAMSNPVKSIRTE